MTEVVGVKFKSRGKMYFFDPAGITVKDGESVIVETSKGVELGECVKGNHQVDDSRIVPPLRPIVRAATAEDLKAAENNRAKEKEAFGICQKKIADHGLEMKLVDVEYNFEGNKILFFFTSEGRVDFRELVKDLASVFRMRIELRQIGVRDEAKMLGGLGICGRSFCCSQFLGDFQPVSTKMAKTQSMSLNPTKISGSCGRLMCCLRYEQEAYEDLLKTAPKNGAFVETPAGYGSVSQVNLLRQRVKVRLDGDGETMKTYSTGDIAVVPGGRPKPGEPLPSVLPASVKLRIQKEEEEAAKGKLAAFFPASDTDTRRKSFSPQNRKPASASGPARAASQPPAADKPPEGSRSKPRKNRPVRKPEPKPPVSAKPEAESKPAKSGETRNRRNRPRGGRRPGPPPTASS